MHIRLTNVVVAIALLAAACGGATPTPTTTTVAEVTTTTPSTTTTTTPPEPDAPATDFGVDVATRTISIGVLADLSGGFAALSSDVVDAQQAYWDLRNGAGGVEGWRVDLVVADTRNDPDRHREAYDAMASSVAAIGHSAGSTTNATIVDTYIDDSMLVVPASWFSGWPFRNVDQGVVFEQNTNYCFEAMNTIDFIADNGAESIAIVTLDDAYGRDAAVGAREAAGSRELRIAFDGGAAVRPGDDLSTVIASIVEAAADWVYFATSPALTAELMAGAVAFGYEGLFAGAAPTYDSRLLDSASGELFGTRFYHSTYGVAWGDEAPGNLAMMNAMREAFPDRRPSDAFIVGWNAGIALEAVIAEALARDDLTRSGLVRAANSIDGLDFGGSAPVQSWVGTPDVFAVRASYIYKPDLELYLAAGGAAQTISDPDASTGSVLITGPGVGPTADAASFDNPCVAE